MKWIVPGLVVVAVAVAGFAALPHIKDWYRSRDVETRLLAQPVYRVLSEHEPATFARLRDEYRRAAGDKSRLDVFTSIANSEISAVATRRIAHASQDTLLALMNDMLGNMQRLQQRPGDDCFRYLFPQIAGPPDTAKLFDPEAQQHTLGLMAEVIRTAAEDPVPLPAPADVQGKLGPIIDAVYAEFGADTQLLSHPEAAGADRTKVCAITISLYERVLKLPPADASALLRSMTQL